MRKYPGLPDYHHITNVVFQSALSFDEACVDRLSSDFVGMFNGKTCHEITKEITPFFLENRNNQGISEATAMQDIGEISQMTASINLLPNAKRFVFSNSIREALCHTNTPKNIQTIRLPFKQIMIEEWFIMEENNCLLMTRLFEDHDGIIKAEYVNIVDEGDWNMVCDFMPELLNMILYLTSEKPDMVSSIKKTGKKKKGNKVSHKNDVIIVGQNYKSRVSSNTIEEGSKLSIQFMVRGHWRNQPIKDGYKRIFIEPFWKGPDMAEVINKSYKIL